ncbi:hypothetical protein NG819_04500 [Pseudarthrobacter sp. Fe7]|nr:hypothetical protein NG819_04500 [Pseudarthrobacter sp. Fe7]
MKQHNINAIRTSHYPPHPDFLALADQPGVLRGPRMRPRNARLRGCRMGAEPQ